MTQPLIIIGTGGSAYDVLDIVDAINALQPTWRVAGFLDDARPVGSCWLDLEILGTLAQASRFAAGHKFVNVIGSDQSYLRRPEIVASTRLEPARFAALVHPAASVSSRAKVGRGVYVNHGASVGGNVLIGDHVAIGPGAIIGHDSVIEDYAIVAAGAVISGFCGVGRSSYIGAGATIRQKQQVGERALVGLGAVVIGDVEANATVVGNPHRMLRKA